MQRVFYSKEILPLLIQFLEYSKDFHHLCITNRKYHNWFPQSVMGVIRPSQLLNYNNVAKACITDRIFHGIYFLEYVDNTKVIAYYKYNRIHGISYQKINGVVRYVQYSDGELLYLVDTRMEINRATMLNILNGYEKMKHYYIWNTRNREDRSSRIDLEDFHNRT